MSTVAFNHEPRGGRSIFPLESNSLTVRELTAEELEHISGGNVFSNVVVGAAGGSGLADGLLYLGAATIGIAPAAVPSAAVGAAFLIGAVGGAAIGYAVSD